MGASPSHPSTQAPRRLAPDWAFASFDHQPRTRLVFGNGAVARLDALVDELGARRVLLVTDPGIVRAGHAGRLVDLLSSGGREVLIFDRVRENPDTHCVDDCVSVAAGLRPEVIIGLGGGSAMDTAKGCNFLLTNGGRMQDYWGVGKARLPMLPFIAIPTTAGTGSECQSAALIADAETHQKMACLDPKASARVALLDPELTCSQPAGVAACTGIDAVAHALETLVTSKRSALSVMYSREAWRLLSPSLPRVLAEPADLAARGRMLLGAALAGTAIELSMLGAAHAAANPLTAHLGVTHGVAVGAMLPQVVRFNADDPEVRDAYAVLAPGGAGVEPLVGVLEGLLDAAGVPRSLAELGVTDQLIPLLASEAARQWTAGFNPRPVDEAAFRALYTAAMEPRRPAAVGDDAPVAAR